MRRRYYAVNPEQPLLTTLVTGFFLLLPFEAIAQDQVTEYEQEAVLEEVIVTGIRAALERSLEKKRLADGVMDAISAEDMGKTPDQNLAEALQRITGVNISRDQGQGTTVDIRGASPEYNGITVNGRTLTSGGDGNAVSLDVFSSEMFSGIEVFKTPQADMDEGSLGGTVNLIRTRPLDRQEGSGTIAVKASYNDRSEETDPKVTFGYLNQFNDRKFGLSFGFNYEEATTLQDSYETNQWVVRDSVDFYTAATEGDFHSGLGDYIGSRDDILVPRVTAPRSFLEEREKFGANVGLQFALNDRTELLIEGGYASQKKSSQRVQFSTSFDTDEFFSPNWNSMGDVDASLFSNGEVTALMEGGRQDTSAKIQTTYGEFEEDTLDFGIEAVHYTDNVRISGGIAHAQTEQTTPDQRRLDLTTDKFPGYYTMDANDLVVWTIDGVLDGSTSPWDTAAQQLFFPHITSFTEREVEDEATSAQFDVDWNLHNNHFSMLSFGVKVSDREKNKRDDELRLAKGLDANGLAVKTAMRAAMQQAGLTLADLPLQNYFGGSGFFDGDWAGIENGFPVVDLYNALDQVAAAYQSIEPDISLEFVDDPSKAYTVQEDTTAAYLMASIDSMDGRLRGNLGVRWVSTDTTSEGTILNPRHSKDKTGPDLVGDGCDVYAQKSTTLLAIAPGEIDAVSGTVLDDAYYAYTNPTTNKTAYDVTLSCAEVYKNDYSDWLPSMNLRYEITDELVGRMALYRSMSRPDMKKIAPELRATSNKSGEIGVARLGNPYLKPTIADGIDLGLEWYFDKSGLLSVNYFYKDLTDLIYNEYCTVTETSNCIPGIDNEAALGFNEVRRAENGTSGTIEGVEFNYEQAFTFLPAPWDGLGLKMGYTMLESDAEYISLTSGGQITLPMPNMSEDSYNFQAYYDRENWEVRVAYKYRSEYLTKLNMKDNVTPVFADDYGQWDLTARYSPRWWENVSFTFEGLNLTDEVNVQYSAGVKQLVTIRDYNGRRFQLGMVYKF